MHQRIDAQQEKGCARWWVQVNWTCYQPVRSVGETALVTTELVLPWRVADYSCPFCMVVAMMSEK